MRESVVQAGLIAGDAGVDLIGRINRRLGHPVGIGQQRPRHRYQLNVCLGEDLFGGLGHVDPVGRGHRDVYVFGQCAADVDERTVGHGRHDGGHPCLVPADAGVDECRPRCLDFGCQRDDLIPALAVLHVVGHRHPVADDELRPHRRPGASDDLDRHTSALLGCPAPRVGAFVGARGEELIEQVALAAHDLDAVIPGVESQQRAAHEVVDGLLNPAVRQRARPKRVDGGLDRRGTDGERVIGVAPGVEDLQQDFATGIVHAGSDEPVPAGL